ncbi:glycoside hydrolase family 25 protein [Butyrivibrio sp. INlla21]|uniref:glycoside hydrolase family 25 protein n=1 Tax=Butyrivibrio sp. INlla21 TaxID=1520811 RepID=UPI0008E5B150|nr:GH25 family lysozyme [Butyrivibrio sp. INlla21]SFU87450.1 Glycosyl hydrolases family 25 [Butyrivibrio sp. INlla21]
MKKKKFGLFAGKKAGARRREKVTDFKDYRDSYYEDEDFEDEYDRDDYDDRDYAEDDDYYSDDYDDVDRNYNKDDARYDDERDYRDDDRYYEDDRRRDDRYEDDVDYREDDRYEDEDGDYRYDDDADYRDDDRYADEEDSRYEDTEGDRYADDEDYRADEDDRYEDADDEDYRADEDDRYADDEDYRDEDDRYADDVDYRDEDDRYADDEDYRDADDRYADDEDYRDAEDRYEDEDDDRYADDDYDYDRYADDEYEDDYDYDRYDEDDRYASASARGNKGAAFAGRSSKSKSLKSSKKSAKSRKDSRKKNRKDRDDRDNAFARFLSFVKGTSAVERTAAAVGVVILAGIIAAVSFFSTVVGRNKEIGSFAEIGSNMGDSQVVGQSGLIAMADAEKAKSMTAEMVEGDEEEEEEEEEEEDDAAGVKINMSLTTIKSDMKIKFVNSKTNKLVASVPFKVDVVTPDGSSTTFEDDDKDGIIYKKELKAGKYKVTPIALTGDYAKYDLDTTSKTLNVKDTVEMKAVDVSNEIKKESQVNAAKEDTAVQTQVESVLKDTVEWVESTKTPIGDGEGDGEYEKIDNDEIDLKKYSKNDALFAPGTFVKTALFAAVGDDSSLPENKNNSTDSGASTGTTDNQNEKTDEEKAAEEAEKQKEIEKQKEAERLAQEQKEKEQQEEQKRLEEEKQKQEEQKRLEEEKQKQEEQKRLEEEKKKQEEQKRLEEEKKKQEANKPKKMALSWNKKLTVGQTMTVNVTDPKSYSLELKDANDKNYVEISGKNIKGLKAKASVEILVKADGYDTETIAISIEDAKLKNMALSYKDKLTVGQTMNINVSDPKDYSLELKNSKDSEFVELSGKNIKGLKAKDGKVEILVKASGYNTETIAISVVGKGKLINTDKITLKKDQKYNLTDAGLNKDLKVSIKSDNTKIVDIDGKTLIAKGAGKTKITISSDGYDAATIEVTVADNEPLKDKDGNILYIKNSDGKYVEATYADYLADPNRKFYRKAKAKEYKYTGWQTIDGKTYFFKKDHEYVTGEQVIQGAKYTFGADGVLSSGSGSRGIDVSKWNGSIDWKKVKNEGIDFAIIRCGYRGSSAGALIEDPTFRANMKGAQAAGIKVGVYFFTQAVNEVEAVEEASMVINLCKGYGLSYPVYLDVEGSNGRGDGISTAQRTANIKAFCGTIQNAGYKAGVYANKTWFTSKINTSQLTGYKIWLAQYAATPTYNATRYDMWQYTSKGKVSGISGNVDMNTWYR